MPQPSSPRERALSAAAALLVLALSACSAPPYRAGREPPPRLPDGDGMPAWVINPQFDAQQVYGVGADVHHDRERAMLDARNDIARQLGIVVEGDGRDDDADDQQSAGGSRPRVLVDHLELPGVTMTRMADIPRCLYVQVAFNREAWATGLRQRIADLDHEVERALVELAAAEARPLGAAAQRYQRLLPLLSDREVRISHLRIADPGSPAPFGPTTLAAERERFTRALDQVALEVVADPELESVLPQLFGACANLGLHVAPDGPAPTLRLRLQLRLNTQPVDGMLRLEGDFDAETLSIPGARALGDFHVRLRASSTTETIARDRLMRKILLSWTDYLEHDFAGCLLRQ